MNDFIYIYLSIKSRLLNSTLTVLLTSFGVLIAILLSQISNHVEKRLKSDGKGVDIVVGAKGSPSTSFINNLSH